MVKSLTDLHEIELREQGYTLIDGVDTSEQAEELLLRFGDIVPQYDGNLRYEVKAAPQFQSRSYSKSSNTILAHTEAPGWAPPPHYLALHCHVQATCGAGHTDLADCRAFLATLDPELAEVARTQDVAWLGHNASGVGTGGVRAPIADGTEEPVFRFSYNLLTSGAYEPSLDGSVPDTLPLGETGVELAHLAAEFFRDNKVSILIPPRAVLIWDNQRMLHARSEYQDNRRHLTRYWLNKP